MRRGPCKRTKSIPFRHAHSVKMFPLEGGKPLTETKGGLPEGLREK